MNFANVWPAEVEPDRSKKKYGAPSSVAISQMLGSTDDIRSIAIKGILNIEDVDLRNALNDAYHSNSARDASRVAGRVFLRFCAGEFSGDSLARFISGWRATHGTALFVSALVLRLQREAQTLESLERDLLLRAACELGEIIAQDAGVDDTPHGELFASFATSVLGDDRWLLSRYSVQQCMAFREYVKSERLYGSLEQAILTTAASESWNSGEYSYFNELLKCNRLASITNLGCASLDYISRHAGETESTHFLHAIEAWRLCCEAKHTPQDLNKAVAVFQQYFSQIESAFRSLDSIL